MFRAFTLGTGADSGNPCEVVALRGEPASRESAGETTRCETWAVGERRAEVRCYTAAGVPIQCCGHGLLCCATHWARQWGSGGVLVACGDDIPCFYDSDTTWVDLPALAPQACATPAWLHRFLGGGTAQRVKRCATAGPDDGYLVIELAIDSDLGTITPPSPDIDEHTRRALVVTCAVSEGAARCGEQVHFRYFAPQYGVIEDAATGSAMRVLAPYWYKTGTELVALQRSPAGGLLRGRVDGGRAWVGGRVSTSVSTTGQGGISHG